MKGLVIIGDYFEDVEMIAPVDVWRRHNDEITIASLMHRKEVISARGIKMECNILLENANLEEYDFLFIPGGPGVSKILVNLKEVSDVIEFFASKNKLVCAICAAPMLIGRLGLLKDKNYTVYPGFDKQVIGGKYLRDKGAVKDGNFITGKSMYYSIEFALLVIESLYGMHDKENLLLSIQGEN
ncbi:MAG: DJ-1/PfpI family protein [Erysipelotrichales bacterium]|nr:DJ-1/PfpI family protein [Erysipelotrichales bacterium]